MSKVLPFTLRKKDFTDFSPDRAVEFFRKLLWAEASRVGIGGDLIHVPGCINVADGGIDALINEAKPSNEELIPNGTTGFQIKSSDLEPAECVKELHEGGDQNRPIKPEIKRILDNGGNYVLVLFADISSPMKRRRTEKIQNELAKYSYKNTVRVYTADQLKEFSNRFIGLVIWLKPELSKSLPYNRWASHHDVKTPETYIYDDERRNWMESVRAELRNLGDKCPIYRLSGLPGIGKTRLVFEALSDDDLKYRVIYVRADQFKGSSDYTALQINSHLSAILVIDECDLGSHAEFVKTFAGGDSRFAVITMSHDIGGVPPPTNLYTLPPLKTDKISQLLKAEAPHLPTDVVSKLSVFADGYPRIATILADSYRMGDDSADKFIRIPDDDLMDRLMGKGILAPSKFEKTVKVLTGISLFRKVGYVGRLNYEAKWLSEYTKVDIYDFEEIVSEQKERGIIQGQYYIYVTPFMLRVHLLSKWWKAHGLSSEHFDEFVTSIPAEFREDMFVRFTEHIPYIPTAKRGRDFVKTLLDKDGIFADGSFLKTRLGADFFLKLADADPPTALACLMRTIGTWDKNELLQFTTGRREIVWALERIAIWRDLFPNAARLLLALGDAENETWSNNASGVFSELFSPAYGEVAPTEASPQERFPILEEAINSTSKNRRFLAVQACNRALESQHFMRMIGGGRQGVLKEPERWKPETYKELFDAYRRVWSLISGKLDDLKKDEQKEAVAILLQRSRGLGGIENLSDMVVNTLNMMVEKSYVDKKALLSEVLRFLHYEGKTASHKTRQRWEQLKDQLYREDFSSLLHRYVGMNLIIDKVDEEGNYLDTTQSRTDELAHYALENWVELEAELEWLVTEEAQNGFIFGYSLGSLDEEISLLPRLNNAQSKAGENASLAFLGGYYKAIFEVDRERWENQLDVFAKDKELSTWVPELTWRSGMSDQAAIRIISLAENKILSFENFRMFGYGSSIQDISNNVFQRWIRFLINIPDIESTYIALELFHSYYGRKESKYVPPEELTYGLLTHPLFFQETKTRQPGTMDEFHWTELGKYFVSLYTKRSLELVDTMLEHFGEEGTILGGFFSKAKDILGIIAQQFPREVWERVARYLGPPIDTRAFHLKEWLRGSSFIGGEHLGTLPIFPLNAIWEWVDEAVDERAWYFASFVPNKLFLGKEKPCFARQVLIRYGTREDVRRNLMANFSTEGWSGSESVHLERKKRSLLEYKNEETNNNVIS